MREPVATARRRPSIDGDGGTSAAALTFPIASSPRSKKNMMPSSVKRKPKAVRPRPISVVVGGWAGVFGGGRLGEGGWEEREREGGRLSNKLASDSFADSLLWSLSSPSAAPPHIFAPARAAETSRAKG